MTVYNQNRDSHHSLRDEIKEQNAKLKGATLKEKLAYYKEYYLKMTIVIIIAVIGAISLAVSILTGPEGTAFAAYFINNTGSVTDDTMLQDFVSYAGIDTKKYEAYIDTSLSYDPTASDYYAYIAIEKSMAIISTNELDVIIGDDIAINYYAGGECFADITTLLPQDLMEQFSDKLYYYTNEETGEAIPVGIYVEDSPKLQEYHYYDYTDGRKPILGFLVNSDSIDNAITFLRYIYTEE